VTTRGLLVGVAITAALVWLNAGELTLPVRVWTTALLAGLPALMVVQAAQLREIEALPRRAAYVSSILSLWLLAGLTVVAARLGGMSPAELGFATMPLAALLLLSGALTIGGIAVIVAFHLAGFRESDVVRQLVPESATERRLFVGVSVTAGVCEEIVFRGFLIPTLLLATGSLPLALLLSSGVFGVVHAYQQPTGAVRAALLGALLAAPLLLHGSIYPAIIAHACIDVIAGLFLARYLTR
jgi:uncharacterized protein